MANGIIPPLLGRNVTISITPQDVAANGTFSDNALGAQTFNGRIDNDDLSSSVLTENIVPTDGYNENPVPYGLATDFTITEIMEALPLVTSVNKGYGYGNVLQAVARASLYHKIVITLNDNTGTPVKIEDCTIYALMVKPRGHSHTRTKNTNTASFSAVQVYNTSTGAALANPAFS